MASRSAGIFVSDRSDMTASTPTVVRRTASTRPTSVPRYVTLLYGYSPAATGRFTVTRYCPMPNNVLGSLRYMNVIIPPANTVMTAKKPSWIRTRLLRFMSRSLIPAIRGEEGVGCGVRARQLSYGASPLHFEFGQVTLPTCAGEQCGIHSAQRQVRDHRDVRVVAPHPFRQRFLREGKRGEQ